jgi:hypothetical protein
LHYAAAQVVLLHVFILVPVFPIPLVPHLNECLQALGKRLGQAMKTVGTEIKSMSSEAVLAMQVLL